MLLILTVNIRFSYSQGQGFRPGEFYVRLNTTFAVSQKNSSLRPGIPVQDFFSQFAYEFGIQDVKSTFYFSENDALRRTFRIYFRDTARSKIFLRKLKANPLVEYAEFIPEDRFFYTPNDLGPNTTSGNGQWYLYRIRAQQAWDLQRGKSSVIVAVVDDAVQTNHPELKGFCLPGRDVAENTPVPDPPDTSYSHGTHVAGIIAAQTNNLQGIASLAHGVSILPVKITLTGQPKFPTAGYEGISWAVSNSANIINVSWGSENVSFTAQTVIKSAIDAGITVIAAAGNSGNSSVNYPAGYPGVISVSSTTSLDVKATSSNFGTWIDISAPGDKIRSTIPFDKYGFKNGTSFASPLVAALAALIISNKSDITSAEIEGCIKSSADNIDALNPNFVGQLGAGRINAEKALQCVIAKSASYDAGIIAIEKPAPSFCSGKFTPAVRLKNSGTAELNKITINYQVDNLTISTFIWTGNLSPGADTLVYLNEINSTIGKHILKISLSSLVNNNNPDAYSGNNLEAKNFNILSPVGIKLPFTEDFETNSFSSKNWTVENPESFYGWEISSSGGLTPGSRSARLTYFLDEQKGSRDMLITPTLDFSGYSNITMTFRHAYMQRSTGVTDTFIVSISKDCGENWTRLRVFSEIGSRTFATRISQGVFFVPAVSTDWCGASGWAGCSSINLNAWAGIPGIRIKFEGFNSNGNNIYLDNISITGVISNSPPVANFNASGNENICKGQSVKFTNTSLNQPTSLKWSFPGGSPDTSILSQPTVSYATPGNYSVTLTATNQYGSNSITKTNFITVYPQPEINIIAEPDSICRGQSSTLVASGGQNFSWAFSSSLNKQTGDTVIASPTILTTYSVTGYSAEGCPGTANKTVGIYASPGIPVINNNNDSCLLEASTAFSYEWYFNGILLDSSNVGSWQATSTGNYNVRVFNFRGCSSFSAPKKVNCKITGLPKELLPDSGSSEIFPNPAKNRIFIKSKSPILEGIIMNIASQIIPLSIWHAEDCYKSNLPENLNSGMYIIRLRKPEGYSFHRIIIEK